MGNLDNFRQAVESPKSWNSMSYICVKTAFLHLKHYLQIYLTLLSTDFWFRKWHEKYGKFFPEHSKLGFWCDPLIQTWKSMSFKSTEELSTMTMKNYAKFEQELTCHFKVDMRNLTSFDLSTWKSQNFPFNGFLLSKVYIVWTKKSAEELSFMKLKRATKFGEESTEHFKIGIKNLTNFDLSTWKSQKFSH